MTFDDSELFHSRSTYDPVKAHEYYLRKRKLKGRKRGVTRAEFEKAATGNEGTYDRPGPKANRTDTDSRRAELKAQKEALNKRLDRLRDVLAELVEAAKKRSGGDPNESRDEKGKAPETKVDKADRNKAEKKSKPETPSEKKERAKKAKEAYEKENPNTLSQDVDILKSQVEDIQEKIQKALATAKDRRTKAGSKGEEERKSPPVVPPNPKRSGPQGR